MIVENKKIPEILLNLKAFKQVNGFFLLKVFSWYIKLAIKIKKRISEISIFILGYKTITNGIRQKE